MTDLANGGPRILVLTGNQIRHRYFIENCVKFLNVVGILQETKNQTISTTKVATESFKTHLENLKLHESMYMNSQLVLPGKVFRANTGEVNNQEVISWAQQCRPDAIALFGTSILSTYWTDTYEDKIVNLHLGSSPRYRGSATLFWPFFNGEIEHVATTIHLATKKVDAGAILRKISLPEDELENYYQFSTKTIKTSIDEFPSTILRYIAGEIQPKKQDIQQQKYLYKKSDFTEEALEKVLTTYGI